MSADSPSMAARAWLARVLRDHGLSIVLFGAFLVFWIGQAVTGWRVVADDLAQHGQAGPGFLAYLGSAHFIEATMENWESEFFQMAAFVLVSIHLYQRGSSESKAPDEPHESDEDPRLHRDDPEAPWPVRRGGWVLKVYERSLSLALGALFLGAFAVHAASGARQASREALLHGEAPVSAWHYLGSARFWFESFQNWQSEFFSIGLLVVLSIYLRERGSPQSKPVASPHSQTGG